MTVEEYCAVTGPRSDNGKGELIGGEPMLTAVSAERRLPSLGVTREWPALGIWLPRAGIYRDTELQ